MVLVLLRSHKYCLSPIWPRLGFRTGTSFLGSGFLAAGSAKYQQASVVLGNTWTSTRNCLRVLAMILLANLLEQRFPKLPLRVVYFC